MLCQLLLQRHARPGYLTRFLKPTLVAGGAGWISLDFYAGGGKGLTAKVNPLFVLIVRYGVAGDGWNAGSVLSPVS